MEFLLILSAMLSALTGAISGARAPEPGVHQAEMSLGAEVAAEIDEAAATGIETAVPQAVRLVAQVHRPPAFAIAAAIPLYADRPIE